MSNPKGNPAPKHDLSPLRSIRTFKRPDRRFTHKGAETIRAFVEERGRPRGIITQIAKRFQCRPAEIWAMLDGRTYK